LEELVRTIGVPAVVVIVFLQQLQRMLDKRGTTTSNHSRNPGPDVNLHERVATLEANVARLMEDCDG
jgi:hypothetical protein